MTDTERLEAACREFEAWLRANPAATKDQTEEKCRELSRVYNARVWAEEVILINAEVSRGPLATKRVWNATVRNKEAQ